jgi:soluble lytic murein transglycosylase-like protein
MKITTVHAALLAALAMSPIFPVTVSAQQAFTDFSARRVKPPAAGSTNRINVQIAPRANPAVPPPVTAVTEVAAAAARAKTPGAAPAIGQYAWFWQAVSPAMGASGPGRLEPALSHLGKGPGGARVAAPRLQDVQDIAERHGKDLLRESIGTRVSPALALAVISVESGGRADAESGAGAQGLMQLMPATAERFGVTDRLDAVENIRGGIRFLDFLMEKFGDDPIMVLAGYNAGENAVTANGGVPDYAETRDYVPKVLAAWEVARGLCLTPPELLSDGCVFRVSAN